MNFRRTPISFFTAIIILLGLCTPALQAQSTLTISGVLTDAQTGETLPAANIQIKDTYRGTITNSDGRFEVAVSAFPVTLIFRYIGYETHEETFTDTVVDANIRLNPVSIELEELVFTGEDPAMHIMERVILRKQLWRQNLESWKAESYTRQSLSNEDGIVSITESYSTTWWHRDKGFREVLTDKRQTNNLLPDQNFAGTSYLPNFYDDNIRIAGFDVVGVTHPDAFKFYRFKIIGQRQIDRDIIYDIEVIPRTRLQPAFEGTVSVLGSEYALIEVNLVPGEAIFFPPPISNVNLEYAQQFNNYGGEFWLPTDVRISGTISVGFPGFRIPEIRFQQVASILDYRVNVPVPDTLFQSRSMIRTDTLSIRQNSRFAYRTEAVPLSLEEQKAYETIDSTQTLDQAFQPTGFLASLARNQEGDSGSSERRFLKNVDLSPDLRYNRVDALYIGGSASFRLHPRVRVRANVGYNAGLEELGYGGSLRWRPLKNTRSFASLAYQYNTFERIPALQFNRALTSASMLLGAPDYFDHFKAERVKFTAGHRFRTLNTTPEIFFQHERAKSVEKATDYSFPGGYIQRDNPAINDGIINSVGFSVRFGDEIPPFGIAGATGLKLNLEHASNEILNSDFTFTRIQATLDLRFNTFLKRRFLPNTLDIRINAFATEGDVPLQRFGGFDGNLGYFSPYGTFRSIANRQIEGLHGVAIHAEHNFRTVPFELIGARGLVRRGLGVIVHASAGKTWIPDSQLNSLGYVPFYDNGMIQEAGISLNNVFGLFRIDATYRIDRPGFFLGFSTTRFF